MNIRNLFRKRIVPAVMALGMSAAAMTVTAGAFDNSVREGVVPVVFYLKSAQVKYLSADGNTVTDGSYLGEMEYSSGSGFFVGNPDEDPQYVVTNEHVVDDFVNANEGENFILQLGTLSDGSTKFLVSESCEMRVYYSESDYDVAYIDCYGDVSKVDLAVLRLRNPTNKRHALSISAIDESIVGETVYTVGFPGNADNDYTSASKYGVEDCTVHKGSAGKIVMNEGKGVERLSVDAVIQHGNSGGPLVDEAGNVIGVNTNGHTTAPSDLEREVDYYSITSNELMRFLDKNNIPYQKAGTGSSFNAVPIIIIAAAVVVVGAGVVVFLVVRKKKAAGAPAAQAGAKGAPAAEAGSAAGKALVRSLAPQHSGLCVAVNSSPVVIGRNTNSCKIVYKEGTEGVSGVHCSVSYDQNTGVFSLTDLGSTYGTFLMNGQKLTPNTPVMLKPGDSFIVGGRDNVCRVEIQK